MGSRLSLQGGCFSEWIPVLSTPSTRGQDALIGPFRPVVLSVRRSALGRGYSLTRDEAGAVVRNAAALTPGQRVRTRLLRGEIVCRVESIQEGDRDA